MYMYMYIECHGISATKPDGRGCTSPILNSSVFLFAYNTQCTLNVVVNIIYQIPLQVCYIYTCTIYTQVRDLVPESQAYMDLLAFERKLDATISRKRLEIQDMLRRPFKEKRKLRVFISHHFFTTEPESGVRTLSLLPLCTCVWWVW